ncbi:RNB-domain-containing protein [Coniochaeta sp. PMI_546]|nr:RNB-domain-containing protein [Coniochaeta sp. PMI_546]
MLPTTSPAYKCWRCLAKTELSRSSLSVTRISRSRGLPKGFATVHHSNERAAGRKKSSAVSAHEDESSKPTVPIRERLRQWEADNPLPSQSFMGDQGAVGGRQNSLTRAQSIDLLDIEFDMDGAENYQPLFEGDDLVDLRSSASDIQPGDMVELTADTLRIQLLAICLGTFNGYQHFYTSTGKWFTSLGLRTLFVVKQFVDKKTVQKVVESLPSTSGSPDLLNVLQDLKAGPSREAGASLLRRMDAFQNEARLVYQSSAAKLDNAHQVLSGTERLLSLSKIAEALLHRGLKVKGKFSSAALYAVHMALMQNGAGFRPASMVSHTKSYLFTVSSDSDMAIIQKMEYHVRSFLRWNTALRRDRIDEDLEKSAFGQFILKARKAIDDSRNSREWSPHGILKLSHAPSSPILPGWTSDDLEIIEFLHMWAATQKFSAVSRYHSISASILRALERYRDVEYLNESVGWTFLQEIGWIKPWEIQSRYRLRLPGLELERGGGVRPVKTHDEQLKPDLFAGRRKEFTLKCFCIDAESATDIDDGVSLEPAESPGEYWIHVHVADPASRVRPDSTWAQQAAAQTQTTYLWGHFSRMFGDDVIKENFSLANDKPSLTFSAKVNEDGELLDYKITPATLRNVTYISPAVVVETCGDEPWSPSPPAESFSVGKRSETTIPAPSRKMAKAEDLSPNDVNHLSTLSRLASKLHSKRLEKGAVPYYFSRPETEVSFDDVEVIRTPDGFMRCNGDPSIRVLYGRNTGSVLVSSIMQLAGEVAARWCTARGIPIPFRVQPRAAENEKALREFADRCFPKLRNEEPLTSEEWRTFMFLSGGTDISSQPAPNFAMGIDFYTKATSPLRRYSDLLVHWQIEAALLEEERLGHGLEGNKDDSFLPFPRAALDEEIFPVLRVRERHAKLLDQTQGNREWMLQALLRAWKFGENADLPQTFSFTVSMVISKRLAKGTINWFNMDAILDPSGISGVEEDGKYIALADVKVGDVYEVELSDVNVHSRQVKVKALKRVEEAGK